MTIRGRLQTSAAWLSRWVLGAATLACIILWIASIFFFAIAGWRGRMDASLTIGELRFEGRPPALKAGDGGWSDPKSNRSFTLRSGVLKVSTPWKRLRWTPWLPKWRRTSSPFGKWGAPEDWQLNLPLWIPIAVCGVPSGRAWTRWIRRRLAGACLHCGYNLVGIGAGAVCPECGREPPSKSPPS